MPSLDQQLTACAIKYLGGGSQGRLSADGIRRKAMIQYLGGAASLGRLTTEALAARCARQYTGQTFSGMSLNGLLMRWAYAVAGGGTPGRLSLNGVAMRAANKYLTAPPPVLAGQQAFTSAPGTPSFAANSTNFVVPAGVTEISAVSIAAGQPGTDFGGGTEYRSGTGGALRYLNAIPVTPGETLAVVGLVSGVFQLQRGATALLTTGIGPGIGFNGGGFVQAISQNLQGGGAGGYTSNGGDPGAPGGSANGGGGSSLLGGGAGAAGGGSTQPNFWDGGLYGGGAGVISNGTFGLAGPRGLRIIWGAGRAFPNTNTGDV